MTSCWSGFDPHQSSSPSHSPCSLPEHLHHPCSLFSNFHLLTFSRNLAISFNSRKPNAVRNISRNPVTVMVVDDSSQNIGRVLVTCPILNLTEEDSLICNSTNSVAGRGNEKDSEIFPPLSLYSYLLCSS